MRWRWLGVALGAIAVLLGAWVALGMVTYGSEYVVRTLSSLQSDVSDYVDGFPLSTLTPSPEPTPFPVAEDGERVQGLLEEVLGVDDLDAFLESSGTQALVVLKDGAVVYEGYANGASRDTMLTSFSVAKSFDSALVGIAIDEGFIGSVDDPITDYLPELADRDPRFADITVEHLLRMASGLEYREFRWYLFNGDDPLTTYYPDQRELALTNTKIASEPGRWFDYNKYHPQLLGMIIERTTGMSVTEFTQTRLWDPLGMEYEGAWALDSTESGFEKMEAGLNARALDYAKFGQLFLQGGSWDGRQVVPASWVEASTTPDPAIQNAEYYSKSFGDYVYDDGQGYYGYFWYGLARDGLPADVVAEGDRAQIIHISPANGVVVVRNGLDFGISIGEWVDAFYELAGRV
jgi:CubicO group peptidase (beta-lactamase class C family)